MGELILLIGSILLATATVVIGRTKLTSRINYERERKKKELHRRRFIKKHFNHKY